MDVEKRLGRQFDRRARSEKWAKLTAKLEVQILESLHYPEGDH